MALFRYVVDVLTLASILVLFSLAHGGLFFNLLLPDDPSARRPPAAAPDPDGRRVIERLEYDRPRPRTCTVIDNPAVSHKAQRRMAVMAPLSQPGGSIYVPSVLPPALD